MARESIEDHPDRFALANELHARPFPELGSPSRAAYLAIMAEDGAERDREADLVHLRALLDRFGAAHPAPGANHHSTNLGRGFLKWEQHTEFVTYTLFADGVAETPYDGKIFSMFPEDWLAAAPGRRLTSALVRIEKMPEEMDVDARLTKVGSAWFVDESLAVARVVDDCAVVTSDFRIDEHGHIRFAVFAAPKTGPRRLGRVVQRLLEVETYKTASMLSLPVARSVARQVSELDRELADIVSGMAEDKGGEVDTLDRLLKMAAAIELLSTHSAFRFGAAEAYSAIVNQRIEVLREERLGSRQLFSEFMMRRFDPAMRTCRSSQARLRELSARAERAANLLRTRVDVAVSQQNTKVLERMDDRAALQLRLQETVEGLSVVAISYYAVNLAAGLAYPVTDFVGLSKGWSVALITLPVVLLVWQMVRRIRERIAKRDNQE